jgi:hypothetical protein
VFTNLAKPTIASNIVRGFSNLIENFSNMFQPA